MVLCYVSLRSQSAFRLKPLKQRHASARRPQGYVYVGHKIPNTIPKMAPKIPNMAPKIPNMAPTIAECLSSFAAFCSLELDSKSLRPEQAAECSRFRAQHV